MWQERAWLARIRSTDGQIFGAGFAVSDTHVATCAHVVIAAGATGPGDRVRVDFPLLGGRPRVGNGTSRGVVPRSGNERGHGAAAAG